MPATLLSSELLANCSCPEGRAHVEIFDSLLKGFYVDILRNGRMNYRVRYRLLGKPRVITLGDARVITLDEAREAARDILRRAHNRIDPKQQEQVLSGITVKDFFNSQYLPFVKSYKRSWDTDDSMIRNHVIPRLGHHVMGGLTQGDIADAVNQMRAAGYAPGTCNRFLVLIRYGFTLALRWGADGVSRNPTKDLLNLRDDNRIERFLTPSQSEALLESVRQSPNSVLLHIVHYLVLTGARKREVLDARWCDVDFELRLWRIPKTKSGKVRHVPLSAEALRLLHRLHAEAGGGADFIFPNPATGKPFISIYYSWDASRKRAGIPELRIHDLRHSFASFLVNAGRSLYEVQQLLGHADIRTTSRYAHLSRDRLMEAVETVPVRLKPPSDTPRV